MRPAPRSSRTAPPVRRRALLLLAALAIGPALGACGSGGSDSARHGLEVRNVTIDEPIGDGGAVVRMVIDNTTGTTDRLVAVHSGVADRATMHHYVTDDMDRSTMEQLDAVDIPAGKKVAFQAGGLHVMLEGLHRRLRIGDTVTLTLTFAQAGDRTVDAKVVAIGADDPMGSDGMDGGHDMGDMSS
jgi:copper(I)-binding protein